MMNAPDDAQLAVIYERYLQCSEVCTDTRKLYANCFFVALKGPNFNGNLFAADALKAGAKYALVDEANVIPSGDGRYIFVEDALSTLQALARHHRRTLADGQPEFRILGVTGSNGKTTTKELIASILEAEMGNEAFATPGNLNNHIGLPLCILKLKPTHRAVVLEMGDNHPGDIDLLCEIAEPDAGLVTNIGRDHIGFYGSMEANALGKLELFDYLHLTAGTALLNRDDVRLLDYEKRHPGLLTLTMGTGGHLRIEVLNGDLNGQVLRVLGFEDDPYFEVTTHLPGEYNATNVLGAIGAAEFFGVSVEAVKKGVEAYKPVNNRSQVLQYGSTQILLDAYNANPSSMESALRLIFTPPAENVGLVLGEMNELGDFSEDEHRKLGELVNSYMPAWVITVGPKAEQTYQELKVPRKYHALSIDELRDRFPILAEESNRVLIKGSRTNVLERLIGFLDTEEA
jgi:UDP-N-acetylmuramoyl-tripeptide--D-alanyl-D-alanine ligase